MQLRIPALFLALVLPLAAILFHPQQLSAQTKTTIFNFPGAGRGGYPLGGLVADKQGNLYGTTLGSNLPIASGVVYKLSRAAGSWQETVLHVFGTTLNDGLTPFAGFWQGTVLYDFNPGVSLLDDVSGPLSVTSGGSLVGYSPGCMTYGCLFQLTP